MADPLAIYADILLHCLDPIVQELNVGLERTSAIAPPDEQLLPKQRDFVEAQDKHVLYSGAFGAGKTRALCVKLRERARRRGAREGLCRKRLVDLKATTLKTLLQPEGDLPPVLMPGTYTHNATSREIRIHDGGEIDYFGMDDHENLGSRGFTGIAIDEAAQTSSDDYTWMIGRCRIKVRGLVRQLYGATNPKGPLHYLAVRFGLGGQEAMPNCRAIETSTADNTFLPLDYIEDVGSFTGVARKRNFLGLWVGAEGVIYESLDKNIHFVHRDAPRNVRRFMAIDEGMVNPFAISSAWLDGDARLHVDQEHYQSRMLPREKVDTVVALGGREAELIWCDPSATSLIADLRNVGLPAVEADNDVLAGISRVQKLLDLLGDGRPSLTFEPTLTFHRKELFGYEWDTDRSGASKDQPKKKNDHLCDALRYLVSGVAQSAVVPQIQFLDLGPGWGSRI